MAAPDTLKAFAQSEAQRLQDDQQAAREAIVASSASVASKRAQRDALTAARVEQEKVIAGIRKELSRDLLPADYEALSDQLRDALVELRHRHSRLLRCEQQLPEAEAVAAEAAARLDRIAARRSQVESSRDEAEARSDRHQAWKHSLTQPPLDTIRQDAHDALASDPFQQAEDRIEADLPERLRNRAAARAQRTRDRLETLRSAAPAAIDLRDDVRASQDGQAGRIAKRWTRFLRAEEAFRAYVLQSPHKFDQALRLLNAIVDSPQLTQPERDHLFDDTLAAAREEATDKEEARDQARHAVEDKSDEIAQQRLAILADDVDADLDAHPDIVALKAELTTLQTQLDAASADYDDEARATLEEWEASVPSPIWENLAGFEQARNILEGLEATDPAPLATAMDTAESSLVAALVESVTGARTLERLAREFAPILARREFAEEARSRLLLAAIRGDD